MRLIKSQCGQTMRQVSAMHLVLGARGMISRRPPARATAELRQRGASSAHDHQGQHSLHYQSRPDNEDKAFEVRRVQNSYDGGSAQYSDADRARQDDAAKDWAPLPHQ